MRFVPVAFASVALLAAATTAAAVKVTGAQAAKVMHARHEGMETIGKANKVLHRELDSSSPSIARVRASAAQIASLSRQASNWFPEGTGPEVGKTGAKAEIWQPQNKADFAAKLSAFQRSAQAFNAAASANDINAVKARFADLSGACKACHDKYRTEMHH